MPAKGEHSTHCKRGHPRTIENMFPSGYKEGGKGPKCRVCQEERRLARLSEGDNWAATDKGKISVKNSGLKIRYKIDLGEHNKILCAQQGACPICGIILDSSTKNTIPHVDHAHDDSQKVRGLLCGLCNRGLGQFKDNLDRLGAAIKYLKETQ